MIEEILKLVSTAIKVDYLFLLGKGDETLHEFLKSLNDLFVQSFHMKIKLEALNCLYYFFLQFFEYRDEEFELLQNHERRKGGYISNS